MSVHELSRAEARRIAVRAQLLDATRPDGLVDLVRHLTMVQLDATKAVAPSADLVAWSRLGDEYALGDLTDAVDHQRLVELRGMVRPPEDVALYRADMDAWFSGEGLDGWKANHVAWVRHNDACRLDILQRLRTDGPLPAGDLPDTCVRPWKSSGWNNNRNVILMLEQLELRGEVAVAGRSDGVRLWDLASRVYPDDPGPPADEALRIRNERRLRALGIARARGPECPVEPNDVGDAGEPAVVDGVRGEWRVDPAQLDRPFSGRLALLSPLDRLVFDRKRMVEVFEFDYQLEMYKPAATRRWGYWALPILYGDLLVGKVDASADHKSGVLRVNAVHRDRDFSKTMNATLDRELSRLAAWLRLDLAPPA